MRIFVMLLSMLIWKRNGIINSFKRVLVHVKEKTGWNKCHVAFDMIISNLYFGCTFEEYNDLKFYKRSWSNRNTYLTYYYNVVNYFRLNSYKERFYFKDKCTFNTVFNAYLKREWIKVDSSREELIKFVSKYDTLILKPIDGDSGDGVMKIERSTILNNVDDFIVKHMGYLLEECIVNHELVARLNPMSLNTLRVVAIVSKSGKVNILFTGLRVGSPGECVDNISKGGRIAVVNIANGMLENKFYSKQTLETGTYQELAFGAFILPYWNETIELVRQAAKMIKSMRYNAWDIAITPDGPALIEGNHGGAGNQITQLHFGVTSPGLKPKMKQILKYK